MKKVTRTIETLTIKCASVTMENGNIKTTELEPVTVENVKLNNDKALATVRKKHGKNGNYVILGIDSTRVTYGVPYDKFMEIAEIIPEKEAQETEAE